MRKRRIEPPSEPVQPKTYNRRLFMAWCDGILMDRDAKGKCLVLDGSRLEKDFEAAEVAMDRGERITLTDDAGKPVSTMARMTADRDGDPAFEAGYVEEEWDEAEQELMRGV
jgi:hypothetical protein